jgi:putative ATP-binding cassette transporter
VELPKGEKMFFIPSRPYLPIGTLRGAVSYPASPDTFGIDAIKEMLRRVGLEDLTARLDESGAWEKKLSPSELQRLGFARLLLHRPSWILLQEALDSLDAKEAEQLMRLLFEDLPNAAVLTITHQSTVESFHQRAITLQASPVGVVMKKETAQRRERDRRGREDVGWSRQIAGLLRKDRRNR